MSQVRARHAMPPAALVPEKLQQRILLIRGHKVMLDADLAVLYGVSTRALNQAVKRNLQRFPADFMIRLTRAEGKNLRSHFVTSSWGGRRYPPYAFTEHGTVMLASILNSPRAVEVSVYVVRAFVQLREFLATHRALAAKLAALERKLTRHDTEIRSLFEAIKQLMTPPDLPRRRIGFHP